MSSLQVMMSRFYYSHLFCETLSSYLVISVCLVVACCHQLSLRADNAHLRYSWRQKIVQCSVRLFLFSLHSAAGARSSRRPSKSKAQIVWWAPLSLRFQFSSLGLPPRPLWQSGLQCFRPELESGVISSVPHQHCPSILCTEHGTGLWPCAALHYSKSWNSTRKRSIYIDTDRFARSPPLLGLCIQYLKATRTCYAY